MKGNPLNSNTGNKFQKESDYIAGGPFPLELTHLYNNYESNISALGVGWGLIIANSEPYNLGFMNGPIPNVDATTTVVEVNRSSQANYVFALQNGQWVSAPDAPGKLEQLKDASGKITGWRFTSNNGDVGVYGPTGGRLSFTNRQGWSWTYTSGNNLWTVTDSVGRKLTYTFVYNNWYDAAWQLKFTTPGGGVYTFQRDSNRRLASITYPDGKIRTYLYENTTFPNYLTGIVDENGNRYATWSYDAQGRATSSWHGDTLNADHYLLAYNANGTTTVTDPLGTNRTSSFTTVLGVAKGAGVSQPGGSGCSASASALTYDANGNVASSTDFRGYKTTYTYNPTRNLETSRTEGLSSAGAATSATRTVVTQWHATWPLPIQIDEYLGATATGTPVKRTTYAYDSRSNITQVTESDPVRGVSSTTSYAYTYSATVPALITGMVVNGPRTDVNDITTYTYYDATNADLGKRGNLATVTDATGKVTQFTAYNGDGHLTSFTDPNSLTTTLTYDLRGRLTGLNRGGEATTYTRDAVGQITRITQPDGSYVNYTYDAAHRLTDVADNAGNTIHYTLDWMGNRTREDVKDPGGALVRTLSRAYDALNRMQTLTGIEFQ